MYCTLTDKKSISDLQYECTFSFSYPLLVIDFIPESKQTFIHLFSLVNIIQIIHSQIIILFWGSTSPDNARSSNRVMVTEIVL